MTISNNPLTCDLLLGNMLAAWSNSDIRNENFTKPGSGRHQTFGFASGIVHCTLKRRAADA
jgi:hypothetical protein